MFHIHCLNKISPKGRELFTENYQAVDTPEAADAILVRSAAMKDMALPKSLLAVARAGVGFNNIPLERCAEQGTVVFNTPGANANAVVELTICGMLLACRDVVGGIRWVQSVGKEPDIAFRVEKEKSRFAGMEAAHKKLGIIGLGSVGGPLANAALNLGMEVYGYDPFISVDGAWHLDSRVIHVKSKDEIFSKCDMISLHVPLLEDTRHTINAEAISKMKKGVIILNFARDALVDDDAMESALQAGKVARYVTDFPNPRTAGMQGVIAIPHLGASTKESEENCAQMAVKQLMNYLENGNIVNSVNFPNCDMGICTKAGRVTILHRNIPNSLGRFTSAVAEAGINISDLLNRSRGAYAYTMLDLDQPAAEPVLSDLQKMEGVLRVRKIK